MKYILIFLFPLFSIGQTSIPQAIRIATIDEGGALQVGTSSIWKYNNKLYLVSNYHLLAGRANWDTTKIDDPTGRTPKAVLVWLYKKDGSFTMKILSLVKNGVRLFYSERGSKSKSVLDIAILPLDSKELPTDAELKTIEAAKLDNNWILKPKSNLEIHGFRGDTNVELKLPRVDKVVTLNEKYTFTDTYIYASRPFILEGSSGGLIFTTTFEKKCLVGIVSGKGLDSNSIFLTSGAVLRELVKYVFFESSK